MQQQKSLKNILCLKIKKHPNVVIIKKMNVLIFILNAVKKLKITPIDASVIAPNIMVK